jgi:uncharacterized protein YciI
MRYVVIARDGTDAHAKDRRLRTRPAHLDGIERFVERGEILVGGAILDDEGNMVGSIVLADFTTRSELEAWLKADPYVTEGVWQEVEVRGFRPAVGAWLPES